MYIVTVTYFIYLVEQNNYAHKIFLKYYLANSVPAVQNSHNELIQFKSPVEYLQLCFPPSENCSYSLSFLPKLISVKFNIAKYPAKIS